MWLVDPFCLQYCLSKGPQMKKYVTILLGNLPWIPKIRISSPLYDVPLKVLYDRTPLSCGRQVLFPGPPGVKHSGHPGYLLSCQSSIGFHISGLCSGLPFFFANSYSPFKTQLWHHTICEVPSTSFPTGWPVSLLDVLVGTLRIVSGVPFTLILEL